METVSSDDRETVPSTEVEELYEGAFLTQVLAGNQMSVQHFRADPGLRPPEHSHEHEEVGYPVEAGGLPIVVDGEEQTAETGEAYRIPGGESHFTWNRGDEPTVRIMIFSLPRPFQWSEIEE